MSLIVNIEANQIQSYHDRCEFVEVPFKTTKTFRQAVIKQKSRFKVFVRNTAKIK